MQKSTAKKTKLSSESNYSKLPMFNQMIEGARDFACGLYKNQPGALVPNIGDSLLRFAWDNLCPPPYDPPQAPIAPFKGGQCLRVGYLLTYGGIDSQGRTYTSSPKVIYGPLRARNVYGKSSTGFTLQNFVANYYTQSAGGVYTTDFLVAQTYSNTATVIPYSYVVKVERMDGSPDNCGDPPVTYPAPNILPPLVSNPLQIVYNDGTDIDVTFEILPPISGVKTPPTIVINVNGNGFKIPICFGFGQAPMVCIDGDGNAGISDLENLVNEFKDEFDVFKDDWDFKFNPPNLDSDPGVVKSDKLPGKEGEEDGIEGLIGIKISLTKLSYDSQFGTPPVYFAGWVTFKAQEGQTERSPINFQEGYFPAPPGATGYAYTLTKGAEGVVRVYSKEV